MGGSVRFWEPGKEYLRIEDEVMAAMREVLSKGDLVMRQQMLDFEHNLAAFVGTTDAIGVSNCTDGLRLLLEAVGIGPGDEVITVSHTFMATMAVIHHVGATPRSEERRVGKECRSRWWAYRRGKKSSGPRSA